MFTADAVAVCLKTAGGREGVGMLINGAHNASRLAKKENRRFLSFRFNADRKEAVAGLRTLAGGLWDQGLLVVNYASPAGAVMYFRP